MLCAHAEDELDPVVVTPTKTPERLALTLSSVTVVDRAQIERSQAIDVADLLQFQPGVQLARSGGPGQLTSVFLRGANSNHSLVLIDGVPINPGTVGNAAVQNIRPDLLDRIEIVKGPLSSLYGSQAIGGVINLITRRESVNNRVQTQARLAAGSEGTKQGWLGVQGGLNRLSGGFDLDYLSSDGYPPLQGEDTDRGFRNTSLQAYGGYTWDSADLRLRLWQAGGRTEYLDLGTGAAAPLANRFINQLGTLALEAFPSDLWRSRLQLSYYTDKIDQSQVNPFSGREDFAHTYRTRVDWQNDLTLAPENLLTLGLMGSLETVNAESFGTRYGVRNREIQAFAQENLTHGPHQVVAAAGLYHHQDAGEHLTWNLSYGYQWTPQLRLSAAAGSAFKAPDSTQRFGFGGNPDLEPEQSLGADVALRYVPAAGHRVSVTAFYQRIRELIQFEGDFFTGRNENVGKARNQGIEVEYGFQQAPWQGSLGLVLQDPVNLDTDDQLLRRSREQVTASLLYHRGRFALGGDLLALGQREDFNGTLGAYWILNLTGRYQFAPAWYLEAKIENLFDADYEPAGGYNGQGRLALVGVRYAGVP